LYLALAIIVVYVIMAFTSVFYAAKKLCKPGISKESQKLVLIRHVVSILGFLVAQLYIGLIFVYMLVEAESKNTLPYNSMFTKTTKLLFLTQGIYLPLLRIAEPFFFAVFKRNVRYLFSIIFCCKKPVDKNNEIDEESLDRKLFTEQELDEEAEQYQMIRQTRLMDMGYDNHETLEAIN
jgi:hypothetical protein